MPSTLVKSKRFIRPDYPATAWMSAVFDIRTFGQVVRGEKTSKRREYLDIRQEYYPPNEWMKRVTDDLRTFGKPIQGEYTPHRREHLDVRPDYPPNEWIKTAVDLTPPPPPPFDPTTGGQIVQGQTTARRKQILDTQQFRSVGGARISTAVAVHHVRDLPVRSRAAKQAWMLSLVTEAGGGWLSAPIGLTDVFNPRHVMRTIPSEMPRERRLRPIYEPFAHVLEPIIPLQHAMSQTLRESLAHLYVRREAMRQWWLTWDVPDVDWIFPNGSSVPSYEVELTAAPAAQRQLPQPLARCMMLSPGNPEVAPALPTLPIGEWMRAVGELQELSVRTPPSKVGQQHPWMAYRAEPPMSRFEGFEATMAQRVHLLTTPTKPRKQMLWVTYEPQSSWVWFADFVVSITLRPELFFGMLPIVRDFTMAAKTVDFPMASMVRDFGMPAMTREFTMGLLGATHMADTFAKEPVEIYDLSYNMAANIPSGATLASGILHASRKASVIAPDLTTQLSAGVSPNATTISLATDPGKGAYLKVNLGQVNEEVVLATSVSGGGPFTVTVTPAIANSHNSAETVTYEPGMSDQILESTIATISQGNRMLFRVKRGVDGRKYRLALIGTLDNSAVLKGELEMSVAGE